MGLCKDFQPVLPFPSHCTSLPWVLHLSTLIPAPVFAVGPRLQVAFLTCGRVYGQPWPRSLGKGDTVLVLTGPRLHWRLLTSRQLLSNFHRELGIGGATDFSHVGKESCPKLAAWSTEMCCLAPCPAVRPVPPCPRQLQEASWCQQPPLCRRVGGERQHLPAASCCFIFPILHCTLSYALLHF